MPDKEIPQPDSGSSSLPAQPQSGLSEAADGAAGKPSPEGSDNELLPPEKELPFTVSVPLRPSNSLPSAMSEGSISESELADFALNEAGIEDLEQAYLQALQAMDSLEEDTIQEPEGGPLPSLSLAETPPAEHPDQPPREIPDSSKEQAAINGSTSTSVSDSGQDTQNESITDALPVETLSGESSPVTPASPRPPKIPRLQLVSAETGETEPNRVTPEQVLEATFFVGGGPYTAKKLCSVLQGSFEPAQVEILIDDLNQRYLTENRPYLIRLGEGGYQMELREEHERLRQRVYGAGPREVKLSQDVLEVLALVAYKQPISVKQIESLGKVGAGSQLRQLLRRELIAIERGEGGREDVRYHTTARFLSLFGLGSLDDLPRPDDVDLK